MSTKKKAKAKAALASKKNRKQRAYELPPFHLERLISKIRALVDAAPNGVVTFILDLFCGAGGTSEGIERAKWMDKKCSIIIGGINHDLKAIYSQAINHPDAYYTSEDIRLANLEPIKELIDLLRSLFPQCPVIIWASLECTNHSNAKGGMSRDADSRTLAWDLNRYIETLNPDGIWIENVKEFKEWGPLQEKEVWKKGAKKIKNQFVSPDVEMEYYQNKIALGEIGSCPLNIKKDKKKRIIDFGPTWVPDPRFKATFYKAWLKDVEALGYHSDSRILNAADFGAPTNRYRFFLIIMRNGWPIAWPEPTHSKEGTTGMFVRAPHVPVKTCLDFSVEGRSVFEPGHVDSKKTWIRLFEGCVKFIAGGKDAYRKYRDEHRIERIYPEDLVFNMAQDAISTGKDHWVIKYMGNNEHTGVNPGISVQQPCVTVPCGGRLALGTIHFISKYNSSHNNTSQNAGSPITEPCHTVTASWGGGALIKASFLTKTHGDGGGQLQPITKAAPTVACKDQMALVQNFLLNYQGQSRANSIDEVSVTLMTKEKLALIGVKYFISKAFKSGQKNASVENPSGALTTVPKADVVRVEGWIGDEQYNNIGQSLDQPCNTVTAGRHYHYLYNPSWFGQSNGSTDNPCMTVVARQDKAPLYLVDAEQDNDVHLLVPVFADDCDEVVMLKEFMALYGIVDIKKRMLMIKELLKIQSFPETYFLAGSQTDQKKFIGNAVPPLVAKAIAEAMYSALVEFIPKQLEIAA